MSVDERGPDEFPEATLEDAATAVEGVLDEPEMKSVRGAWVAIRASVSSAYGDPDLLPDDEVNVISLFHRPSGDLVGMFPYHLEFDEDGEPFHRVRLPWFGDVTHEVGELPAWAPHERPSLEQNEDGAASDRETVRVNGEDLPEPQGSTTLDGGEDA